jgi:N-acetylneuraminic acid mutarotase
MNTNRLLYSVPALLMSLFLVACGNGSSHTSPPVYYSVGGAVTKLVGNGGGLHLQNNGSDTLSVDANGTFAFATQVASGSTYSVTISAQPSTPAQRCGVTNGTGTVTGDVTDIVVDCGHNEWTWMSGINLVNQAGTYGTMGSTGTGNLPGSRFPAATWMDASGDLWLLGGDGCDSNDACWGSLNDLWKFDGSQWTWMSGANVTERAGTYGTMGIAAPDNTPGARRRSAAWTDSNGNMFLFGGCGVDGNGLPSYLNDLWEYSNNQWTWTGGSEVGYQAGTYGTLGVASASNIPGARWGGASWKDSHGNFWLFGGEGDDSTRQLGELNDLWKYSGGQWTWMSGGNTVNQTGVYGTIGTAATSNVPGARWSAASWTDKSGNLWLFGGNSHDPSGTIGALNDLWKYSGGQWTWMGGAKVINQPGAYGTLGTAAPGNVPGARFFASAWTDTLGNFWLFGGIGFDSAGQWGELNDLWKYSAGQWTWVGGANVTGAGSTYGTQGVAAPGNFPGFRERAYTWTDPNGNFWLFGGMGVDSAAQWGFLNELWVYEP